MQPIVYDLNRFLPLPTLVRILNSQQKCSMMVTREQPIKERSPRASDMEETGG
jgi:hypothetical protein